MQPCKSNSSGFLRYSIIVTKLRYHNTCMAWLSDLPSRLRFAAVLHCIPLGHTPRGLSISQGPWRHPGRPRSGSRARAPAKLPPCCKSDLLLAACRAWPRAPCLPERSSQARRCVWSTMGMDMARRSDWAEKVTSMRTPWLPRGVANTKAASAQHGSTPTPKSKTRTLRYAFGKKAPTGRHRPTDTLSS